MPGVAAKAMSLFLAVLVGLAISVGIERVLAPRPPQWRRPLGAWCVHAALWLMTFCGLLVLVQRPWFAMLLVSAFLVLLVVISNAKFTSLAEPFTVQDFRYLTDAIRYPRLYLPFLGWGKALIAFAVAALAIGVGFWSEPALSGGALSFSLTLSVLLFGSALLLLGNWRLPEPSLDPVVDLQHLGLLGCIWAYGRALKRLPAPANGFDAFMDAPGILQNRPHLVAVQSESFFDPRGLLSGIRPEVLAAFDCARASGRAAGTLAVPALGANTVRSEFAFLAGLKESLLGAHKFNPYESVAKGWQVETFPKLLKRLGYRTVCIHPYVSSFYRRDRVFPLLGIDEFIDLKAFEGAERNGHYVSDAAVTDKILKVLTAADQPTFVFAITMENHGPLHPESIGPEEAARFYDQSLPVGFDELTVYLRHLRNADGMVAQLTEAFDGMCEPISLCWYGDHVPIMPKVYDRLQRWPRDSDYLIWDNTVLRAARNDAVNLESLEISQLGLIWLNR